MALTTIRCGAASSRSTSNRGTDYVAVARFVGHQAPAMMRAARHFCAWKLRYRTEVEKAVAALA